MTTSWRVVRHAGDSAAGFSERIDRVWKGFRPAHSLTEPQGLGQNGLHVAAKTRAGK